MSIVHVQSGALVGVHAVEVTVEVDLLARLPAVSISGAPAARVHEMVDRVRSAIQGAGYEFPRQRVVVALNPADLRKDGTGLDLPIAIGILAAAGKIPVEWVADLLLVGELSLAGDLRPVRGVLAYAELAKRLGKRLVVPAQSWAEAALVERVATPLAVANLREVVEYLRGSPLNPPQVEAMIPSPHPGLDMKDIVGQTHARRALEVAAAGGHRLLLVGPPGCGKTMLAARLPGILPTMSRENLLEVVRIRSVAGLFTAGSYLPADRPFRAPHHTISAAGLIGSVTMRPGELTLAHRGVLFLDELDQFEKNTLQSLQHCMAQAGDSGVYCAPGANMPGGALLVAAMSPCPCGFRGHPKRVCACSPELLATWDRRVTTSPLRHTFDLNVRLEPVQPGEFFTPTVAPESSAVVRERVTAARKRQLDRNGCLNGALDFPTLERIAWTLADLEGVEPTQRHLEDAASFVG